MADRMTSTVGTSLLYRAVALLDRLTRTWLSGSLLGRVVDRLSAAAEGSWLLARLFALGAPARAMEGSRVGRAITGLLDASARVLGPVADRVEQSALARWWRGSLLSRVVTYEAGIAFVLFFVPLSLTLTLYLPYGIKWAAEAVLLLMLGALVIQWLTGRRKLRWTALDGPVLVWIGISVLSALLNRNDPVQSIFGMRAMFQYYILALVISNAGLDRTRLRRLLTALFGLVALLGLYGVYQWVVQVPTPPQWVDVTEQNLIRTRAFGTMANPNTFGGYLVLFAGPLIALWTVENLGQVRRFLLTVALPLILGAILFTYSRSSWIALVAAMGIISVVRDRRILALFLVAAVALPIAAPTVAARLAQGFSMAYFNKSSAGGRLDWWDKATDVAHEVNPLFGVGPGQFGGAAANYFGAKAYLLVMLPERFPLWVDSQIFQYIAEVGYLGLACFVWVILTFLRCARDLYRDADEVTGALTVGFAGSLVGMLLMSLFASIWEMQQLSSVLWAGMGLICALRRDGLARQATGAAASDG